MRRIARTVTFAVLALLGAASLASAQSAALHGHSWDIYREMVVYVRLNGGGPPASQRL